MSVQPEPQIADGVERPLDPRLIPLDRWIGGIVTAVVSAAILAGGGIAWAAGAPALVVRILGGVWAGSTVGLGWWLQRWPAIAYRHASYAVNPEGIQIRRGVLWRNVIRVPRSRVQHTDVTQGPLERRFGLGTLVIYTAGTQHAKVELRGLDHADAFRVRDHLLPVEAGDAV